VERSPINRLAPYQREGVLQLVVPMNGGMDSITVSEAASPELKALDLGRRASDVADGSASYKKRNFAADPEQIMEPVKPDLVHNYDTVRQKSSSLNSLWQQPKFYQHVQLELEQRGTGQPGGAPTHPSTTALRQLRR